MDEAVCNTKGKRFTPLYYSKNLFLKFEVATKYTS